MAQLKSTIEIAAPDSEHRRLFLDGLWNMSATVASAVVGFVLVPIMLGRLGSETYGLWLAVFAMAEIGGGIDFGLGMTVVREVARDQEIGDDQAIARFVRSARTIYLLIGLAGLGAMLLLAMPFSAAVHASPALRSCVTPVFALIGTAFFMERIKAFALAVLAGLRRYDLINALAITTLVGNAAFVIALLRTGHSIVSLAALHLAMCTVGAWVCYLVVWRLRPGYAKGGLRLHVSELVPKLRFVLASQANTFVGKLVFDGAAPLIGLTVGAAAVVPYRIGQKLPQFIGIINWRMSEVLYPASSKYDAADDRQRMQAALDWGTRSNLICSVPALLTLFIVAPALLRTWVPSSAPETITMLRLFSIAVLLDSIGYAAENLVWGAGGAKALLKITCVAISAAFLVGIPATLRVGVAGVAVGLIAGYGIGTLMLLWLAARITGTRFLHLLISVPRGLLLPALFTGSVLAILQYRYSRPSWWFVVASGTAAVVIFGVSYYFGSSSADRRFVRTLFMKVARTDLDLNRATPAPASLRDALSTEASQGARAVQEPLPIGKPASGEN